MKKLSFIMALILAGFIVYPAGGADTGIDILIWTINVTENPNLNIKKFNSLSKFYLKSKSGDVIQMAPFTYYDAGMTQSASDDNYDYGMFWGDTGATDPFYTNLNALEREIKQITHSDSVDYSAWEFYMQLDNNGSMVAWSENLYNPYASPDSRLYLDDLVPGMVNNSNEMNTVPIKTFNFGSHLVPEPTSGLLLMLGAGLLALRRRRRA